MFNGICSDYLYTGLYYTWISIFHKMCKDQVITYVDMENNGKYFPFWTCKGELCRKNDIISQRLATEEEKKRLFKYIKDNGYKWNAETKTLEKLVEPKFKVGDKIRSEHFLEERTIKTCEEDGYWTTVDSWIKISDQDEWELVPNKFDISTLVPFESKVLVRDNETQIWKPAIFGDYIDDEKGYPYIAVGGGLYKYLIPYEGNEHLRGKTDDCNEFYKTWEE